VLDLAFSDGMTSLRVIEDQINRFLASNVPEVIVIRGSWGSGKTYAWNKFLKTAICEKRVKLSYYSYVSLFGLDLLADLKLATLVKSEHISSVAGKISKLDRVKKLGKKSLPYLADNADFLRLKVSANQMTDVLRIKETIICLDDFERTQLDTQALMGFISELKEERRCKVVLIVNDEKFDCDAKKKYETFREKVVDREFEFSPNPEECTEIVFDNEDSNKLLMEKCHNLGITNIRIIKKIQTLESEIRPFLQNCEEETVDKALSDLVLFTYSLYIKSGDFPDHEFILEMSEYDLKSYLDDDGNLLSDKSEQKNQQKAKWKRWLDMLANYGYWATDTLDSEIAQSVKRGYFCEEDIVREIRNYDKGAEARSQAIPVNEAWALFHGSLENNQDEIIEKMVEACRASIQTIETSALGEAILILRKLGAEIDADELITLAISERGDKEFFNMSHCNHRSGHLDQKMWQEFQSFYAQSCQQKTPLEILKRIANEDSLAQLDEEPILGSLSADDFYSLFKSLSGDELDACIRAALRCGMLENADDTQKRILQHASEAVKRIGSESNLNKLRMDKFNIAD
jgi:hypothetical protein